MPEELFGISINLLIYLGVFLTASFACLAIDFVGDFDEEQKVNRLLPWQTGWVEFGIFFCALILGIIALQLFGSSMMNILGKETVTEVWEIIIGGFSMHAAILLVVGLGMFIYPQVFSIKFNEGFPGKKSNVLTPLFYFLAAYPLVIVTAIGWQIVFMVWEHLGVGLETPPQFLIELINDTEEILPLVLMAVLAIVIAPISEELLFRGCIYRFLKKHTSNYTALTMSSLLFAIIHWNVNSFLPLFLLGMLLCRCYEKTGRIIWPMLFHGLFNLNSLAALLFMPQAPL